MENAAHCIVVSPTDWGDTLNGYEVFQSSTSKNLPSQMAGRGLPARTGADIRDKAGAVTMSGQ